MPTGITSLDPILEGGVPQGSVILLLGEIGAGNYEFAYSSLVHTLKRMKESPRDGGIVPKKVVYISFTRIKEDIKNEILQSFSMEGSADTESSVQFEDLSDFYFDRSIVPDEWYSRTDTLTRLQKRAGKKNIFVQLSDIFNAVEDDSIVFIDSITDIATQSSIPNFWTDMTSILRGIQRVFKQRRVTTYLLLTRGILDPAREMELEDIVDAVLLFKWEESTAARRQRIMYFEKFRGVMPHLEENDLVKFAVRISATGGFDVSNIRVII